MTVYFSIGDAVAGLGIFLIIPQFLKPIYFFRLRVIGIGLRTLYAMAGLGFICVVIAALVPMLPTTAPALIRLPLVWELAGATLYAMCYTALGWVYIFPARVTTRSITQYVRAGSNLLASASEEDRVEFAADVLANIKKLIRIGDEPPGAQSKTWFLSHRQRGTGETSAYSESFLRLLADPVFCRTLVIRLAVGCGAPAQGILGSAAENAGRPHLRAPAHTRVAAVGGNRRVSATSIGGRSPTRRNSRMPPSATPI